MQTALTHLVALETALALDLARLDVRRRNVGEGPGGDDVHAFGRLRHALRYLPDQAVIAAMRREHLVQVAAIERFRGLSDQPTDALHLALRLFPEQREQRPHGSGVERLDECRRIAEVGAVRPQENADGRNGAHRHLARQPEPVELCRPRRRARARHSRSAARTASPPRGRR